MVAAVFAVHPLRVESVAWVSERKDVASTAFGLAALLAYLRFARRGGRGAYLSVLTLQRTELSFGDGWRFQLRPWK